MMWRRQTLAITSLFLRRFAFHPMNLAGIFVMPVVIALIFGAADEKALSQMPIGVLVESSTTDALVDALDAEPGVTVKVYDSRDMLDRAVRRSDVAAGVFEAGPGRLRVLGDVQDPIFVSSRAVVVSVGARGDAAYDVESDSVEVKELATTRKGRATGRPRAAAGMLVYFVFVNACFTSTFLTEDRSRGVISRTAAGPVPPSAIVTGEVLGRVLLAFVQGVLVAIITSLLLDAVWGAVLPLALVLVALSAVAAGTSVLLGIIINRPGPEAAVQSNAFAAVCGLLGGCFWSLAFVPAAMRTLAYVTPHAWALRAIDALAARGAGVGGIMVDLVVLTAFAIAFLALATYGLRRATLAAEGIS